MIKLEVGTDQVSTVSAIERATRLSLAMSEEVLGGEEAHLRSLEASRAAYEEARTAKSAETARMNELRDRFQRHFTKYSELASRTRTEFLDASAGITRVSTEISVTQSRFEGFRRAVAQAEEILQDRVQVQSRAEILSSYAGSIGSPITIMAEPTSESGDRSVVMAWVTRDIFMQDGLGGRTRKNFGKFHIAVRFIRTSSGIQSLKMAAFSINYPTWSYATPHLSQEIPCLGNAELLIRNAMATGDYSEVVTAVYGWLTTYNVESPYRHLHLFGTDHLRDRSGALARQCENGTHLENACSCARCSRCGSSLSRVAGAFDCGCCTTCCVVHHTYDVDAAAIGSGIGGSGCLPTILLPSINNRRSLSGWRSWRAREVARVSEVMLRNRQPSLPLDDAPATTESVPTQGPEATTIQNDAQASAEAQ